MTSAPPPNPIIGLLLPISLIIFALWSIRRSSKKRPTFNPCPICKENVRFSFGFQRGMRGHFKSVHPSYRRWLRKWILINTVVAFSAIISIFPLLYYNIIPARPTATSLTPVGIAVWIAVAFSAIGVGIAHQIRGQHTFRDEWVQTHPLFQRTYGNLRGMEVEVSAVPDKARAAVLGAVEFLFNPIAPVFTHLTGRFIERRVGKSRLDRFEDGRLWFYNGLDMLVSLDVKKIPSEIVDEQTIRVSLKKGRIELKTENSADLNLALSVLDPTRATLTLDSSVNDQGASCPVAERNGEGQDHDGLRASQG